ncbi:MAG: hypothetical protein ACN6NI_09785 [Acinetobacter sp.]
MKNIKPIAFSFIVSLSISFIFLMATFGILAYSGPNSLSSALSTTGSYFGGVATLGAAIIAAHLFNDWTKNAAYNRNEKIINDFWDNYIDAKTDLVALKDLLARPNSPINDILDAMCATMAKLYFYQQKLEVMLVISPDDKIFSELEDIVKKYMQILDIHTFNQNYFFKRDQELIENLNALQPKLLKYLKDLNEYSLK